MNNARRGLAAVAVMLFGALAQADDQYQGLPYFQQWSNTGLISISNDWSGVPGVLGFLGNDLTTQVGADPATLLASGAGSSLSVWANQSNPNGFGSGGVAEFELADPVLALQGSSSADAPFLLFHLDTRGWRDVAVSYLLRDLDGSNDDAIQPVALQYRVGDSASFTNIAAAYVADASSGPNLSTLVTPVSVLLPQVAWNAERVQLRVITANAAGWDEWIGIDDFHIWGTPIAAVPEPHSWAMVLI